MVRNIEGKDVIPNVMLREFLLKEVPLRLGNIDLQHTQNPDSRIESRDKKYIRRALGPVIAATAAAAPRKVTTLDIANHQLDLTGVGALSSLRNFSPQIIAQAASDSGFQAVQKSILEAKHPDSFETRTGFGINGVRVRFALAAGDANAEVLPNGDGAG